MAHFSKCAVFFEVCHIFPSVSKFSVCAASDHYVTDVISSMSSKSRVMSAVCLSYGSGSRCLKAG